MSVSCVTTRSQQHLMNYPRRDSIPTIYLPETISAACPIVRWSNWSNSHKITFMPWWWHRRPWRSFFFLLSAGWSMAIVIIFISFSHNLPSVDRCRRWNFSIKALWINKTPMIDHNSRLQLHHFNCAIKIFFGNTLFWCQFLCTKFLVVKIPFKQAWLMKFRIVTSPKPKKRLDRIIAVHAKCEERSDGLMHVVNGKCSIWRGSSGSVLSIGESKSQVDGRRRKVGSLWDLRS